MLGIGDMHQPVNPYGFHTWLISRNRWFCRPDKSGNTHMAYCPTWGSSITTTFRLECSLNRKTPTASKEGSVVQRICSGSRLLEFDEWPYVPDIEPFCSLKPLVLIHPVALKIFSQLCSDMPPYQLRPQNQTPGPFDLAGPCWISSWVERMFSGASSSHIYRGRVYTVRSRTWNSFAHSWEVGSVSYAGVTGMLMARDSSSTQSLTSGLAITAQ